MNDLLKNNYLGIVIISLILTMNNIFTQNSIINFNENWCFAKGEQQEDVVQLSFDDSAWEKVNLPHDWAISGPFNPEENGYAAKLPWKGVGWYRKKFILSEANAGKRVYFDFDGVMAFPKVYINGHLAGEWDYGYMSFRVDATQFVKFGEANVISVQADTRQHGTRWYPGAGIYRNVRLILKNSLHLAHWGTFVTTPLVSNAAATLEIQTAVENWLDSPAEIKVKVIVLDPDNRIIADKEKSSIAVMGDLSEVKQSIVITNPQRWDINSPNLYTVKTILQSGTDVLDVEETKCGIRTFEFTANNGFFLNNHRLQFHGVNLHHDHGPLGAAFYRRAMERQLEIMKEMGCNAIRTSHNPPAPELLDLCDEMGLVVWNEAFDKWDDKADRLANVPMDIFGEKQIRNFVRRDRNHPSIVVWSIGNEMSNLESNRAGNAPGQVKLMRDAILKYDPTRPVGLGCYIPGSVNNLVLNPLDVTGWNYDRRYAQVRLLFPEKPIIYSESASTLSTRGFYEIPLAESKTDYSEKSQVDSYDRNAARWSDIPDVEFELMETDTFVAGEFVWTGFDYLGEPTPFPQQARSSYFGIVDLCGIPKDRYYLYRSYWRPEVTTIHILPHWNWPDRVGENVPVYVYTNGESAELFLNGKSLGLKTKTDGKSRSENLAKGRSAVTNSGEQDPVYLPGNAVDETPYTRWVAARGKGNPWWQVDLGSEQQIGYLDIDFENEARNYQYQIKISSNGIDWQTIVMKNDQSGSTTRMDYEANTSARYVRIEFLPEERRRPSIREFGVYHKKSESSYYAITDKYRLRWDDVVYQPGELKAVAYKKGKKIGETIIHTAGEPFALRLTPDRSNFYATGEDLSYILVEMLDKDGNVCPLADHLVKFEIEGPAEIAGVGNGNPLSLESFQAKQRKLFNGKAMLILRSIAGERGTITVTAIVAGLQESKILLSAE
jgi:beta-galactosidase